MKKFELEFSDIDFGHPNWGYIPRTYKEDPDDQDTRYFKYLKSLNVNVQSVCEGTIRIYEYIK